MKRLLILFISLAICSPFFSFSQTKKQAPDQNKFTSGELKKIEKSKSLYQKNKFSKAISTISGVQQTHMLNDELWTLRIQYEYENYQDALYKDLMKAGKNTNFFLGPGYAAKIQMLYACQEATLYCENQEAASMYLRIFLVDKDVDANVSKEAKDEFQLGETAFQNGKFESAERHYTEAYKTDTTYYKAALYVGDAFFNDKEYELALPWYQKAVNMQPDLLEGRKYLTDVYMKLHKWKEAYAACLDAIVVYPDVGMFIKLQTIADELEQKFDRHWMPRFDFPNEAVYKNQPDILSSPWNIYRDAKKDVATTCDDRGIIDGKSGSDKYLEVYSWNKMLAKEKNNDQLSFASQMSDAGYLDCYVFVSMFHFSIYQQYADFAKNNSDRIKKYIQTYLVK